MHLYTLILLALGLAGASGFVELNSSIADHGERSGDYRKRFRAAMERHLEDWKRRGEVDNRTPLFHRGSLLSAPWPPHKNRRRTIRHNGRVLYEGYDVGVPAHFLVPAKYRRLRISDDLSAQEAYGEIIPRMFLTDISSWSPHTSHLVLKGAQLGQVGLPVRLTQHEYLLAQVRWAGNFAGAGAFLECNAGVYSSQFDELFDYDLYVTWRSGGVNGNFIANLEVKFHRLHLFEPRGSLCHYYEVTKTGVIPATNTTWMDFTIRIGAQSPCIFMTSCKVHGVEILMYISGTDGLHLRDIRFVEPPSHWIINNELPVMMDLNKRLVQNRSLFPMTEQLRIIASHHYRVRKAKWGWKFALASCSEHDLLNNNVHSIDYMRGCQGMCHIEDRNCPKNHKTGYLRGPNTPTDHHLVLDYPEKTYAVDPTKT